MIEDKDFLEFISKLEREVLQRKVEAGQVNTVVASSDLLDVKWSALEKGSTKILRIVGGFQEKTPYAPRTVRIAQIIDDAGKKFRVVFPTFSQNSHHLLWRIIKLISKQSRQRSFSEKTQNPKDEVFNMVKFNKLPPNDPNRKFGLIGKGWEGREIIVFNCIDRDPNIYEWSKEHKHTTLIARNLGIINTADGRVLQFPDEGLPAFITIESLLKIARTYGRWTDYDIGISRPDTPVSRFQSLTIFHASKRIEEIFPEERRTWIREGSLTKEEQSWEMYDLTKLYKFTSYRTLAQRLILSVQSIDVAFGTHFADELNSLAESESQNPIEEEVKSPKSKSWAISKPETVTESKIKPKSEVSAAGEDEETQKTQEIPFKPAPVHPIKIGRPKKKGKEDLDSWEKLPQELKDKIIDATYDEQTDTWNITYSTTEKLYQCPECGTVSPESFTMCPRCGVQF